MALKEQITGLVESARAEVKKNGVTRQSLQMILKQLQGLASDHSHWTAGDYPDPATDEQQAQGNTRRPAPPRRDGSRLCGAVI